ncbi:hypothetical protein HN51_006447 [Arachis hypogaea]|nr:Glycoside hydrolase family 81 protein [Arachis hypogaea]
MVAAQQKRPWRVIVRATRLALMAEKVGFIDVIPTLKKLLGLAYNDTELVSLRSTLAALEIHAVKMWWHVNGGGDSNMYEEHFVKENKLIGVLWTNKRDRGLWFAPPVWKEFRLGIQLLPLVPVSEFLFSNKSLLCLLWIEMVLKVGGRGLCMHWKEFMIIKVLWRRLEA